MEPREAMDCVYSSPASEALNAYYAVENEA
jgi:hypothetical protein